MVFGYRHAHLSLPFLYPIIERDIITMTYSDYLRIVSVVFHPDNIFLFCFI